VNGTYVMEIMNLLNNKLYEISNDRKFRRKATVKNII